MIKVLNYTCDRGTGEKHVVKQKISLWFGQNFYDWYLVQEDQKL